MMRVIGNDESLPRQEHAVASGALTDGTPVVINADGTVSVVSGNDDAAGTPADISSESNLSQAQAIYDPDTGKVVIAYHRDAHTHYYGAAVVGTVSGTSISFGSITKFQPNNTQGMQGLTLAYDTNEDKVLIAYADKDNSTYGTAIVGTVSGTSISFGTASVWQSNSINRIQLGFDNNSNKFLVAYMRNFPQSRVLTVSGTSISAGSETKIRSDNDGNIFRPDMAFSTSANKFVVVYKDNDQSGKGQVVVSTISGTSVSHGTVADIGSVAVASILAIAYDASLDKFLVVYVDSDDSDKGKAVVGTLSGTSVSFGTPAVFNDAATINPGVQADGSGNFIIAFTDDANSDYKTFVSATVSGTTPSFGSEVVIEAVDAEAGGSQALPRMAYDSANDKFVLAYNDFTNTKLKGVVLQLASTNLTSENYIGIARSGAADGAGAIIDTQGAIADNLSSLTAGQSYFVQTDGTLGTTAADPSVFAGTAVSATKLIVKG
tara:strand:+ start:242 stop:1714 length:1473 start_codon:yes stop_codon:yes gene_type:complete